MTNLSFALDTMTREIRTGYNYYCTTSDTNPSGETKNDCLGARNTTKLGVSFTKGKQFDWFCVGATRILYYYDELDKSIYRRIGDDPAQAIVSSGLAITDAQFYVTGTTAGDDEQPTVTIYLEAQDVNDDSKTYYLQTTVTQRILDI